MDQEYLLKWKDYQSNFFSLADELFASELLTDVTLVVRDQMFEAHQLVLSVCSPYFRAIFTRRRNSQKQPIVFLKVRAILTGQLPAKTPPFLLGH